ncbi:hypothetical protein IOK49_06365 [Fervidicoccus fontis]|uniref:AAA ATPase n=2 Tax=Fervidicoccus fontis TaxID=683846 RepID=I0A079_FERFK|nr:RAD55 family ATPase [Fervidicoccus fontis]AFH42386.1 AAA ATPase [Fervidicoccus fontis Kam940]MBE9391687.1 hypothetical protein [Fervidicoccus fontis]
MIGKSMQLPLVSDLMEGNLSEGIYVIAGPPGIGKSVFVKRLIANSIADSYILYVSVDSSIKDMLEFLEKMNISKYKDHIQFLDAFSTTFTGIKQDIQYEKINLESASDSLFTIYSKLSQMDGNKILVIDSITEMLIGTDPDTSISFIKGLKQITESTHTLGVITIHTGPDSLKDILWILEYLSDGYIELAFEPNFEAVGILLRRIRIKKMRNKFHDSNWYPYKIVKDYGLQFMSPQELKAIADVVTGKKSSQ